ncbi:putative protein serine/threonine kinase [Tieghemostelium lacteum]|uniref:Protein kinase domain-containing protein n=1 Tax=Tieghemostelium lacteum TaxID=361077 RepID=A0A152A4G2_TIELA|nr:putative protein serine/threonine kinase [Tieghemostelium lacteum]|eukprot:KYR00951.1 putative protein serine/threonine kinase [Tieghemostelium lacteum]
MNRERVLFWPETYKNIHELGRGVSGVVYKAAHKETGQIVAIKLVDMNQNRISSEQVQGEIRALVKLNPEKETPHINIIKLIQCFVHRTTAIFILEYVDGGTLEDFMYSFERGLPLNLVSHLLYQLISGIEFMNSHKCSHRDIKPANILLLRNKKKHSGSPVTAGGDGILPEDEGYIGISGGDDSNRYQYFGDDELPILKITDYGYASVSLSNSDPIQSTLAGSPLYMAPEIIHIILSPNLEPKTGKISAEYTKYEGYNPLLVDAWTIGAVAFRLITGNELINAIFPNLNQTTVLAALVNLARMMDTNEFQEGVDLIPNEIRKSGVHDQDCIDFLTQLLVIDPKKRAPLKDIIKHPFLKKGKLSFEKTINQHYPEFTNLMNSQIPSDIHNLVQKPLDNSNNNNNNNNNNNSNLSDTVQIENQINNINLENNNNNNNSNLKNNNSSDNLHVDEVDMPVLKDNNNNNINNNNSKINNKQVRWSISMPTYKINQSPVLSFLSHQRKNKLPHLFPTLLPAPTPESPAQDTMTWRSPPLPIEDNLTWTTIAEDAIFQVQFGVLTSILKVISASEAYQFRIITQTKTPLEIAVSNYKESILYMYNIVKTIVAPQLISLSFSFSEESFQPALAAILQQLSYEQEQFSFSSAWTVLL